MSMQPALLALENGMIFNGYGFGDCSAEACGEIVFNTAMSGYQEIITDPSYKGQIVTFTYPHIGNYGVNPHDVESSAIQAEGIVVHEYSKTYSNWRSTQSLGDYLASAGKIGIEGIDTRKLVRVLRSEGAMRCIITTSTEPHDALLERVRALPSMNGLDLCPRVTCSAPFRYSELRADGDMIAPAAIEPTYRVAAIDFGIKTNILRRLSHYGCTVDVYPADTAAETLLALDVDGYFLSNGPGDPAAVTYGIETSKNLIASGKPVFGICLGHQILGLAFGAATYKLKFGHRGANHPVKNLLTGSIEITSQNHGFAVDTDSLPAELEATHINLNDMTLSGFRHRTLPVFCVQYHPESSPGPHDSDYLFRDFTTLMEQHRVH
ncbi:MAG: glutamine-hydrolyzing carbamoyl-phosphate synthase small subunit [Candidatus Kapabacteria bacterium]|nr:glutamine-hydrolyzing carbamoyl-phosphate synthase small subunit [Candidatus Kapabacteria bacterium]